MFESFQQILYQNLPGVQKGMLCELGEKKIERVLQYLRLFPETQYIFIGDDGQGDFEAARGLLELTRNADGTIGPTKDVLFEGLRRRRRANPGRLDDIKNVLGIDGTSAQSLATRWLKTAKTKDLTAEETSVADEDAYVLLLEEEETRQTTTPVFDFVAIKSVKTNYGFLFNQSVRDKRELKMQRTYG